MSISHFGSDPEHTFMCYLFKSTNLMYSWFPTLDMGHV
jgi:hypothetical protein